MQRAGGEAAVDEVVGDQLTTLLCNSSAITESISEDGSFDLAACQTAREACFEDPTVDVGFGEQSADELECNFDGIETCDATVGEYSRCFDETARMLERAASEVTCERFAQGDYPDETSFAPSAECQALMEECSGDDDDTLPPPE